MNTKEINTDRAEIYKEFKQLYPNRVSILKRYEEANGEIDSWASITNDKLYYFVEHLKGSVSVNSARTYAAMFKSFLNLYSKRLSGLSNGWEKKLSLREIETTAVDLTEGEVNKLINYALDPQTEGSRASIAATFAICCITGARWEDSYSFKSLDLGGSTFKYISQKTDVIAEIPVSPVLRELVPLIKKVSLSHYNRTIRSICQELKINSEVSVFKGGVASRGAKWEFVSSHTARRSFATNLYKRGADLEIISKMMGHTSYQQTKRYINSSLDDLSDNIKNFFNK